MAMSKQDFIALADAIRNVNDGTNGAEPFTANQVYALAAFCGRQNDRFNCSRWLSYIAGKCGPNGGTIKAA